MRCVDVHVSKAESTRRGTMNVHESRQQTQYNTTVCTVLLMFSCAILLSWIGHARSRPRHYARTPLYGLSVRELHSVLALQVLTCSGYVCLCVGVGGVIAAATICVFSTTGKLFRCINFRNDGREGGMLS